MLPAMLTMDKDYYILHKSRFLKVGEADDMPENTKAISFRSRCTAGDVQVRTFCAPSVADGIGEEVRDWSPFGKAGRRWPSRIFIESPSGTGKTAFVLEHLLPVAAERGRSILFLGSRAALQEQRENALRLGLQRRESAAFTGAGETYGRSGASSAVTLLHYRDLPAAGSLTQYAYLVFDDVHALLEDSLFNAHTDDILRRAMQGAPDAVWVFLSSAMQEVGSILLERSASVLPAGFVDPALSRQLLRPHNIVYKNTLRRAEYDPFFYRADDALLRRISETDRGEKWLIFVTSIRQGRLLQQRIRRECGRSAAFLSSASKGGRGWELLLKEGRFEQEVLVATRVLGSGVRITDSAVRHIALPFCEQTAFLQLLDRCAVFGDSRIALYAELPTVQKRNILLAAVRRRLDAIDNVRNCPVHRRTNLLQRLWDEGRQEINCLFRINDDGVLTANELAREKLSLLEQFYSALAMQGQAENSYERCVLSWLDMDAAVPHYLGEVAEDGLAGFLSHYASVPLSQDEQEVFYQEFQRLFVRECAARFVSGSAQDEAARSIRKGTTQRKATVNRQLRVLGLGWELKKEHNCWVLRSADGEESGAGKEELL